MASNLNVKPAGTERLGNMLEEETSYTLQRHNTENSKQIFPEKELHGHSTNSYIHVSVSDLYIPPDRSAYSAAGQ